MLMFLPFNLQICGKEKAAKHTTTTEIYFMASIFVVSGLNWPILDWGFPQVAQ